MQHGTIAFSGGVEMGFEDEQTVTYGKWRRAQVLLLDADPVSAAALSRVIRAAAAKVEHHKILEDAGNPKDYHAVIINYDSFSPGVTDKAIATFREQTEKGRLLVCSRKVTRQEFIHLLQEQGLANFMARNDELDSEELLVTVQKIVRGDVFGIDKYFSWGAHSLNMTFRNAAEINQILEQVRALSQKVRIPSRLADVFLSVVDELATNAVHIVQRSVFPPFGAHDASVVNSGDTIEACIRYDGRRLAVSITDRYGSLQGSDVLKYLGRCMKRGADQVEWKNGGAGLGLYQSYESLSHFIVNLLPGSRTEVIGLIDVRGSYRDFALRGKSLNVFVDLSTVQYPMDISELRYAW